MDKRTRPTVLPIAFAATFFHYQKNEKKSNQLPIANSGLKAMPLLYALNPPKLKFLCKK